MNIPAKKSGKDMSKQFSKEKIQMADKHKEKCSRSLVIGKMQISITSRYLLIPDRMAININNKTTSNNT